MVLLNCLRFATPAEANWRPEARRDTMRTWQGRTSGAERCGDERQPAIMEQQSWKARILKGRGHPEGGFLTSRNDFWTPREFFRTQ